MSRPFRVALATAPFAGSVEPGMKWVETYVQQAAESRAEIVCFAETYIPGLRGLDEPVARHSAAALEAALAQARDLARRSHTALILPMEWASPAGLVNVAMVISAEGVLLGYQTKNQLDPSEDANYVPGDTRHLFEVSGVTFGIAICHEGFRYPESVRWAAARGASIVFHPHCTGSNQTGRLLSSFRAEGNPYYESAMMCRAMENGVFFASVNNAFAFQESATCVIAPSGDCMAYQPYGAPGLLVVDIDPEQAHRTYARRYNPQSY